ncbi:MAG: hypothetical protein RL375_142 [Pseudomonadota bacterium]
MARSASTAGGAVPTAAAVSAPRWQKVPRVLGRLSSAEVGLVINEADPYSVAVGEHYIRARQIAPGRVLRVSLPRQPQLSPADLERLREQIAARFDATVQALALAWVEPYAVSCQSITAAVTLGLDPTLCRHTCGKASASALFNSASSAPFRDHGLRPSMLLAAPDLAQALALIDRGVAADRSLGWLGSPPSHAWFLSTGDVARNVRAALFPPPGPIARPALQVHVERADQLFDKSGIVMLQTGLARLWPLESLQFVPGALADHLTSFGGALGDARGQTSALAWIAAGATASYGTVSEPCNHQQKFPHPQLLLLHYAQGATAIEAYWKSVAWPAQGVFIGEPLAAPFAR